jgi:hypothetical protein
MVPLCGGCLSGYSQAIDTDACIADGECGFGNNPVPVVIYLVCQVLYWLCFDLYFLYRSRFVHGVRGMRHALRLVEYGKKRLTLQFGNGNTDTSNEQEEKLIFRLARSEKEREYLLLFRRRFRTLKDNDESDEYDDDESDSDGSDIRGIVRRLGSGDGGDRENMVVSLEDGTEAKSTGRDAFTSLNGSTATKQSLDDGAVSVVFYYYQLAVLVVPQGYSVLATKAAQGLTFAAKLCSLDHLPGVGTHDGVCVRQGMRGLDKMLVGLLSPLLMLLLLLLIALSMVGGCRLPTNSSRSRDASRSRHGSSHSSTASQRSAAYCSIGSRTIDSSDEQLGQGLLTNSGANSEANSEANSGASSDDGSSMNTCTDGSESTGSESIGSESTGSELIGSESSRGLLWSKEGEGVKGDGGERMRGEGGERAIGEGGERGQLCPKEEYMNTLRRPSVVAAAKQQQQQATEEQRRALVGAVACLLLFTYTSFANSSILLLNCVEVADGKRVLMYAGDQECLLSWQWPVVVLVVLLILLPVIPLALWLNSALRSPRRRRLTINKHAHFVRALAHHAMQPFTSPNWHWAALLVLQRMLTVLCSALATTGQCLKCAIVLHTHKSIAHHSAVH